MRALLIQSTLFAADKIVNVQSALPSDLIVIPAKAGIQQVLALDTDLGRGDDLSAISLVTNMAVLFRATTASVPKPHLDPALHRVGAVGAARGGWLGEKPLDRRPSRLKGWTASTSFAQGRYVLGPWLGRVQRLPVLRAAA
jgi:hypothetical protein